MSFDLDAALRRTRPQRRSGPLRRRDDEALTFVDAETGAGAELMLDTCVYIDVLQGGTPTEVDELLLLRNLNHSTVCLAELTRLFGRLAPEHPQTRAAQARLREAILAIRPHRLSSPSARASAESGMLAGLVARLGGGAAIESDAALYLHALERGCVVLTRNLRDFDLLEQVLPNGGVLYYRSLRPRA